MCEWIIFFLHILYKFCYKIKFSTYKEFFKGILSISIPTFELPGNRRRPSGVHVHFIAIRTRVFHSRGVCNVRFLCRYIQIS